MGIYYHGTSADNLEDILQNGLRPNTQKLWSCSGNEVYMWCPRRLAVAEGNETDELEWQYDRARSRAQESGQIACAVAKDCRIVVCKIRVPDTDVMEDTSCAYMDGAVCTDHVKPSQILEIYVSNDLSLMRGLFMTIVADMDMWNKYRFTDAENKVIKLLKQVEWYSEMIDEMITWITVKAQKKKPVTV
jgi:hypothetical protein